MSPWKQRLRLQIDWRQKKDALFNLIYFFISLGHSAYITFHKIMSFRKPCHVPFRKLILPFTFTEMPVAYAKLQTANCDFNHKQLMFEK